MAVGSETVVTLTQTAPDEAFALFLPAALVLTDGSQHAFEVRLDNKTATARLPVDPATVQSVAVDPAWHVIIKLATDDEEAQDGEEPDPAP